MWMDKRIAIFTEWYNVTDRCYTLHLHYTVIYCTLQLHHEQHLCDTVCDSVTLWYYIPCLYPPQNVLVAHLILMLRQKIIKTKFIWLSNYNSFLRFLISKAGYILANQTIRIRFTYSSLIQLVCRIHGANQSLLDYKTMNVKLSNSVCVLQPNTCNLMEKWWIFAFIL